MFALQSCTNLNICLRNNAVSKLMLQTQKYRKNFKPFFSVSYTIFTVPARPPSQTDVLTPNNCLFMNMYMLSPSECWFIDVWCCWLLIYSPNSIVTRFSGAHHVFDFLFSYFDSNGLERVSKCVWKKKTLMTKAIVNHVLDDEVQHSPRVHGRVLWCPGILHRRSLPSRSRYLHRRFPSLLRIDRK